MGLALEDLFFNGACGDEAVYETILLLAVTPYTRECLLISSWIPIWVEEDKAIGADEIETASTSFRGKEEDEFGGLGIVEFVDELLPFRHIHCAVKAETAVTAGPTEHGEDVEGLRVVGDEDDFVVGFGADAGEHAV